MSTGLRLIAVALLAASLFMCGTGYTETQNEMWRAANQGSAKSALRGVRELQAICKSELARYCSTTDELLQTTIPGTAPLASDLATPVGRARYQLEQQKGRSPDMTTDGSFSGPAYFVTIAAASADAFTAEARYRGFATHGADVWTLGATGDPVNVVARPEPAFPVKQRNAIGAVAFLVAIVAWRAGRSV